MPISQVETDQSNEEGKCSMTTPLIQKLNPEFSSLDAVVTACMPKQGSIELQHDQAGKEHAWHTHPTDETIVVLDGKLRFYWDDGEAICGRGDVVQLPQGTRHGSVALEGGAKYIITFEKVSISA